MLLPESNLWNLKARKARRKNVLVKPTKEKSYTLAYIVLPSLNHYSRTLPGTLTLGLAKWDEITDIFIKPFIPLI